MRKRLIVLLLLSQSVFAQTIIRVSPRYVLIDTDIGIGNIGDEVIIYRLINGENIPVGCVKIVKMQNGRTAAKIVEESKGYKIKKMDFIQVSPEVLQEEGKAENNLTLARKKGFFGAGAGITIPTGYWGKYYYIGPHVSIQVLGALLPNLSIGCRVAGGFNLLNEENFKRDLQFRARLHHPGMQVAIFGMCSVFDVSPLLRINLTNNTNSKSYPFFEGGCGSYFLSFEQSGKVSYMGYSSSFSEKTHEQKFGYSIGGGIRSEIFFKKQNKKGYFEILALCHNKKPR